MTRIIVGGRDNWNPWTLNKDPGLQELLDSLWNLGLRPKDIGTAGHLAATQAHLNDMRAIVSNTLSVDFPKP